MLLPDPLTAFAFSPGSADSTNVMALRLDLQRLENADFNLRLHVERLLALNDFDCHVALLDLAGTERHMRPRLTDTEGQSAPVYTKRRQRASG